MNIIRKTLTISTLILGSTLPMGSFAQVTMSTSKMDMPHQMTLAMTDGDVKKVDLSAGKITIKHGEIKNLEMPGMTMVFQVKEPAMLEKVKAGDKVRFTAEQLGSAIVVTNIQPGK